MADSTSRTEPSPLVRLVGLAILEAAYQAELEQHQLQDNERHRALFLMEMQRRMAA